jgi:opacity protein-like surface antigen
MRLHSSLLSLAVSILFGAVACITVRAQTDVALSVYGAFTDTVNKNNAAAIEVSPSNAAGGMIEVRHIKNTLIGYEATYSFNRANQVYTAVCSLCAPAVVSADAHQVTGDWVISAHAGSFRPFALAGVGVLLNEPVSGQSLTQSFTTPVYVYGAGLDWRVLPHIGLRFQYRGNVHKASDVTTEFSSISTFTHTAEPMIGAYFRF